MTLWKKTILRLVIALVVLNLISSTAMNVYYYGNTNRQYRRSAEESAALWAQSVDRRLEAADQLLRAFALELYDSGIGVQPGSEPMSSMDQSLYQRRLHSIALASTDLTGAFLVDRSSGLLLMDFTTRSNVPELRSYLTDCAFVQQSFTSNRWQLLRMDAEYVTTNITVGKYEIGAFLETGQLLPEGQGAAFLSPEAAEAHTGEAVRVRLSQVEAFLELPVSKVSAGQLLLVTLPSILVTNLATAVLVVVLLFTLRKKLIRPVQALHEATQRVKGGDLTYQIQERTEDREFAELFDSFNDMTTQIQNLKIEAYDRQIEKQQDELAMLRAQIRPHFYINAVTTISNMTYDDRGADIRKYISALTKYMRYMLSLKSDFVTVGEELQHIENYIQMQELKMPGSVKAEVLCDEAARRTKLPYLTIFTVVGNTFKHAADLYHTLELSIRCTRTELPDFKGCVITVSDNGKGFAPEIIAQYSQDTSLPERKDHYGLTNIIRTLQLSYHRTDLFRLCNRPEGGAVVEIKIPDPGENIHEDSDCG